MDTCACHERKDLEKGITEYLMRKFLTNLYFKVFVPLADIVLLPLTLLAAWLLRGIRKAGVEKMPFSRAVFQRLGVLPVTTHYYDPLVNREMLTHPVDQVRDLPGINLNIDEQLALLQKLNYSDELTAFPLDRDQRGSFHYRNGAFGAGDGEILYALIRRFKPGNIIEIGGGFSTAMAAAAVAKNREEDQAYSCRHVCIEPYENPWLSQLDVEVIRQRVEDIDPAIFNQLGENDILFIDSSHIIRPQGDVVVEYLQVLPCLGSGVMVHIHDIFTPRDYPERWLFDSMLVWNEQYLLEAFLSGNSGFRVMLSLNHLFHSHKEPLCAACPVLASEKGPEPGSFWMVSN